MTITAERLGIPRRFRVIKINKLKFLGGFNNGKRAI